MDAASKKTEFERKRERFVRSFLEAVAGCDPVECRLLNDAYTFGWRFEEGNDPNSWLLLGNADFGVAYIRHMINQGIRVSFVINTTGKKAEVILKCWEYGNDEPLWPSDFQYKMTSSSHEAY